MPDVDPRDFGRLESDVRSLKDELHGLRSDIRDLTAALDQIKGGRAVLIWLIGAAFAAGGLAVAVLKAAR